MNSSTSADGPFDRGMLDVGDGHHIYWECYGNSEGKPAIYFHGGPGGGFSPNQRQFFDLERYRLLMFDQRGCGRSRPLASEPDADLSANTTQHLIADIEALRELHEVESWVALGLSWGTTLGLAYAQTHPDRVSALVLGLVTTTSQREVEWITREVGRIFPQEWDRFASSVPDSLNNLPLVDAYAELLFDPDPTVRDRAAREWCHWEDAHISMTPGHQPSPRYEDPQFRILFARLVTHYWRNAAFLEENQLIRDAAILNDIPGVLIHGRYDVSSPLVTAWQLSQRWTSGELQVIDDAGHGGGETLQTAITAAVNRFSG